MPRFFFNTEGDGYPPDREGTVLPSPDAARSEAVALASGMLRDIDGKFWGAAEWRLQVTDEQGATVCVLIVRGMLDDRR